MIYKYIIYYIQIDIILYTLTVVEAACQVRGLSKTVQFKFKFKQNSSIQSCDVERSDYCCLMFICLMA